MTLRELSPNFDKWPQRWMGMKRHKAAAGMRGYLDFIREHVP